MELFPARWVLGYEALGWWFHRLLWRRRSHEWQCTVGTIEGYEMLEARENGWLAIFYSYKVGEEHFSGEFRCWFLFDRATEDSKIDALIRRFPRGADIQIRVNPKQPSQSVAIT